jgi:RNA polymerase sigma factor (sigma-70 family)
MTTDRGPSPQRGPPTGEIKFEDYERVLWGVLGILARKGYVTPPDEGRDLIHDFYVEHWHGLQHRFDPELGRFSSYLFQAFYRFARRRILLLGSWRSRLVDLSDLARHAVDTTPGPPDVVAQAEQVRRVEEAVSALPPFQWRVLREFLSGEGKSERYLAQKHGITRHRLREILMEAVGRVAAHLGGINPASGSDALVAVASWQEGRSVEDTAALFGLTPTEVRAARRRLASSLLAAIRGRPASSKNRKEHDDEDC